MQKTDCKTVLWTSLLCKITIEFLHSSSIAKTTNVKLHNTTKTNSFAISLLYNVRASHIKSSSQDTVGLSAPFEMVQKLFSTSYIDIAMPKHISLLLLLQSPILQALNTTRPTSAKPHLPGKQQVPYLPMSKDHHCKSATWNN
jgi:hypothetical protein